ncbi:hypothetical protein ACFX13_010989 [Malus domestica]
MGNNKRTCSDVTTGGIKVHVDGLRRVLGFQVEKLRDDDVGSVVVDGSVDANDPLLKEAGEDVVRAFPSGGVLNDHGDQAVAAQRWAPWPATCQELRL